MHNKHSFKTRKTRKTSKARKMHGGKLHEACDSYIREKLRENYDVDNDEDVEEMNHAVKHQSLSIEKFSSTSLRILKFKNLACINFICFSRIIRLQRDQFYQ